jgi:hypothetical protein
MVLSIDRYQKIANVLFFIRKFVHLVIELGRAMGTFPFKTFWWEIRLLGKIEVGEGVAYGGERESTPTILTSNHPVRHTNMLRAQSG